MNLSQLVVQTKTAKEEFPGLEGFVVEFSAVSREVSRRIQKESEVTKIDRKRAGQAYTEIDEDKFVDKFASEAIKGWKGLKYKYLPELVLVDLSSVEDLEEEVEYNQDNAIMLLKNSTVFDNWINDRVFDLESFRG